MFFPLFNASVQEKQQVRRGIKPCGVNSSLKSNLLACSSCSFLRSVRPCWRPARTTSVSGKIDSAAFITSFFFARCPLYVLLVYILYIFILIMKLYVYLYQSSFHWHACGCASVWNTRSKGADMSVLQSTLWSLCVAHFPLMSREKRRSFYRFKFNRVCTK